MRKLAILSLLLLAGCEEVQQANPSETPNSSRAEKVASIMAAEGITIGDVATFVHQYGYSVYPSDPFDHPHWRASDPEAAYYVVTIKVAVGDTTLGVAFRDVTSSPYCMTVQGFNAAGVGGKVSDLGCSDNRDGAGALKGVEQP